MPKDKPYTIYAEGCEGMKPGSKVQIMGEGVVGKDGMVTVQAFEAEGGPNSADKALAEAGVGAAGLGMSEDEDEE